MPKTMIEMMAVQIEAVGVRFREAGRTSELEENPRRPPRRWFRDCVAGVEAGGSAYDPRAVCGAQWQRLSAKKKRAAVRRSERRDNPYHRYGNPWAY